MLWCNNSVMYTHMNTHQINMWYILSLYNVTCQLYLKKAEGEKKDKAPISLSLWEKRSQLP